MFWVFLIPSAIVSAYKYYQKIKQENTPKNSKLYLICWIAILTFSALATICFFISEGLDIYKLLEFLFSSFIMIALTILPCGIAFFNKANIRPFRNLAFSITAGSYIYFAIAIYFGITQ